jgi:hypothetical protein
MKLTEWLDKTFKHVTIDETIGTLTVPKINIALTIGLISTSNKEEFKELCFNYLPVGTIIDEIDDDWYKRKVLLVRNILTEKLLTDKRAKHYLDILERRDKEHWQDTSKSKEVKVESKSQDINITISDY